MCCNFRSSGFRLNAAVPLIYHQQLSSGFFSHLEWCRFARGNLKEDTVKPISTCSADLVASVIKLSKTGSASVSFVSRCAALIPCMVVAAPLAPKSQPMTMSAVMGGIYEQFVSPTGSKKSSNSFTGSEKQVMEEVM